MRVSNYELKEILQNIFYVLKTKIGFPRARLIRFPITVRGKKYIDFGCNLTTGRYCRIEVNGVHKKKKLIFGDNVNIGDNVSIRCANSIIIGNNVLMGSRVLVIDNAHGAYSGVKQDSPDISPNERKLSSAPIVIEDNVWIGENSVIQMGINVGYGSIIAANSVVTKNVPARSIVAGMPAKIIKIYDDECKMWRKI